MDEALVAEVQAAFERSREMMLKEFARRIDAEVQSVMKTHRQQQQQQQQQQQHATLFSDENAPPQRQQKIAAVSGGSSSRAPASARSQSGR